MTVISEGEGEPAEPVNNKAHQTQDAARGCSLDRLVGQEMKQDSLLCSGEPAFVDGLGRTEANGPLEQCGGTEQKS